MRLLVLEDDAEIGQWVYDGLSREGHVVDWVKDGREAVAAGTVSSYDVLILDRMTPGLDGLSVLKALRAAKISTPVLFLTAMGDVDDRVEGLEAGGDDYLTKPFNVDECKELTQIVKTMNGKSRDIWRVAFSSLDPPIKGFTFKLPFETKH